MLFLRDLPKYECIRQRAERFPQIDPRAVESCLVLMRVASDMLDAFETYLARRHGMSQGKFTVLMLLNRDPVAGAAPSELAERSGVTRATMTGLLDGLEREGMVRREGHAEDRRRAVVRLTPKARKILDGLLPDYYHQIAELMGGLSEEEKKQLVDLLGKVSVRLPGFRAAAGPTPVLTGVRGAAATQARNELYSLTRPHGETALQADVVSPVESPAAPDLTGSGD